MTEEAKTVLTLPVKNALANTDQLVCVSNAAGANGGNVSIISVDNLFGNSQTIRVGQADPANSSSWTGPGGTLFFSATFGYIAVANNTLLRFPLSSF